MDSTTAPEIKSNIILLGNTNESGDLIFNLEHIDFADSSGLSALLLAHRLYRDTDRELVLCNLHERVAKLLEISKLTASFKITADYDDAVEYIESLYESTDDEDE